MSAASPQLSRPGISSESIVEEKKPRREYCFGYCSLPANVDRWLRVVVYGLAITLTSCLFAGWQQYSLILLKGGVYSWYCTPGALVPSADIDGLYSCPAQERAVNSLLPLASGFELAGAVAAGVLLDFTGPRFCALLGSALGFISYVMLMYSSQAVDMYITSMAITGVAINLIGFPALTLEDYFPSAAATTAAYVIACQCLSSIISVVLFTVWQTYPAISFRELWWGYLLIVWVPVSIPYIILLPRERHRVVQLMIDSARDRFDPKVLLHYLISPAYIVMNVLSVVLMLQTSYWQLIVRSQLGLRISEFLGYTMPSQAIWALLLGRLTDFTKTPAMIAMLLLMYSAVYGLVNAGHSNVQYVSVFIFNVAMSYAYTVKYSFVQERYPQRYYGTLVGISGAISGAGVIATNILNYIDKPLASANVLALVTIGALPLCYWLHRDVRKSDIARSLTTDHESTKFAIDEADKLEAGNSFYYQFSGVPLSDEDNIPTQPSTETS